MMSSLIDKDVGTLFIETCSKLSTKEPHTCCHCLWLDDKGIELIQENEYGYKATKVQFRD